MAHNNSPSSWNCARNEAAVNNLNAATSALRVSAAPFVPGKNIWAQEFVSSGDCVRGTGCKLPTLAANVSVPAATQHLEVVDKFSEELSNSPIEENERVAKNDSLISFKNNDSTQVENATNSCNSSVAATAQEDDDSTVSSSGSSGCSVMTTSSAAVSVISPDIPTTQLTDDWSDRASGNGSVVEDEGCGGSEADQDTDSSSAVGVKPKKQLKVSSITAKRNDHLNIVFIGHVDAGKSTIGGHIMYLTGMVDKRTLEKYEREAKEKNRESWYLSWALDTNLEERDKGKTVEVGRAAFETERKHFTILDAPGHKSFVPNMISGASQADVAVLVISARKGEFETGFERGGQTREHAMLVKTAGVRHLIVVVNKMDDPTVEWDEARFNEIRDKLTPYLRKCGFNPAKDIYFIPVSGLTGVNLKDVQRDLCRWYEGPSLIEYLDSLPSVSRMDEGPVRLPIVDRYKDMGTIILGKVESGTISKGQILQLMPNKFAVEVMQLFSDEEETEKVHPGENVKLKLKNVEEEDISPGFILCSLDNLCHTAKTFDAQVVVLEHKSIICAGYSAIMHLHTSAEEVIIKALICLIDKKTNEKSTVRPRFIKQDQIAIVRLEVVGGIICLEPFKDFPQLGRFTLRDEGKTIGIGKVLKVVA